MSTFQAIIFGIIQGFAEFLPISSSAHHILVPYLLGWPEPTGPFLGALSLGSFLALLVYFRHDWASMLSSVLQVVLFRKKPMTMDERVPMFIVAAALPVAVGWYVARERLAELPWTPLLVAVSLVAFTIPLWFTEHFGRKSKNMYDWNWLDAAVVGVANLAALIPGAGIMTAALPGALFRNYSREAAAKFALFIATPILGAATFMRLREVEWGMGAPMADLSWLSFAVTVVVSLFSSLLAIGALMKHIQRKGFGQYLVYRWLLAIAVGVVFWLRER